MKSEFTTDDVSPSTLHRDELRVEELARAVEQRRQQLAEAEAELESASASLSWRRLMKDVFSDDCAQTCLAAINRGIALFEANLLEPNGYAVESDGVPYRASDDYADFSCVEAAVDTATSAIESQMAIGQHESGFLALLVLTVRVAQMSRSSEEMRIALTDSEYEDVTEELAGLWTRLVEEREYDVPVETAARWRQIVERHIGPPFDLLSSA